MGTFERLSGKYDVKVGYGYQTKINRRNAGLRKFHYTDAVCINDYKDVTLTENIYIVDQKRCNDRSMETFSDAKYIDVRDGKEKVEIHYIRKGFQMLRLNESRKRIYKQYETISW